MGRSRRLLLQLLEAAGRSDAEPRSIELLAVGWPGRGRGTYRDDDGTHARVALADGSSVIFREYATTTQMAPAYQRKETAVYRLLRNGGLPAPAVVASVEGALLLEDPGGEPLEIVRDRPVWDAVGRTLRRLHEIDPGDLWLGDRPWMHPIPYLIRTLRRRGVELTNSSLALLRGPVADHLDARPRAICCGGYSLPGMLLDGDRRVAGWLSLGYYVSIGDPDRDVVGISTHHLLSDEFFEGYGRRPDPIAAVVYGLLHERTTDGVDEAVARLESLVG